MLILDKMDIIRKAGFWTAFGVAMIFSLVLGGLINGYPQFGKLLLIAVGVSLVAGLIGQQLIKNQVHTQVRRFAESLEGPIAKLKSSRRTRST